jgi:hypothetical protein
MQPTCSPTRTSSEFQRSSELQKGDTQQGLRNEIKTARTEHEKTALQNQIDAADKQIDQPMYELYGLTEEEVRVVEGAS